MKQLAIRADILAKLLLIQETLDVLPDSEGIAAFLRRALDGIPGVTDVHLCVHGVVIPPSDEFKNVCAESEATWNDSCAYDTCALNKAGTFSVPLRTMHRLHGLLMLSLGDEEAFAPYKDFMRNVANVIAMALDHRDYIREINEARANLETRVVERTAKLKESEEKFRAIVETTSDWVWEVNASGVYTYVSPKVKTFLGYEPEEVIGKTPFDFMLPEEGQRVGRIFQAAVAARQPLEQFLHTNQHKDGHSIVLETSGVPIFDALGNFAGYRCIDRDVTRRKRAQEEILHLATFPQFTP